MNLGALRFLILWPEGAVDVDFHFAKHGQTKANSPSQMLGTSSIKINLFLKLKDISNKQFMFAPTEITSASPKAGKPATVCTMLLLSVVEEEKPH